MRRQMELRKQALGMFSAARIQAAVHRIKKALKGCKTRLLNISCVPAQHIYSQHYGGIHAVQIDQICGTLGRTEDFDDMFNPLDDRVRDRWVAVAVTRLQGFAMDAVQLIQIGSCYFVKDGHHRISVARALGQITIDAEITIWEVAEMLPWNKPVARPAARLATECAVS
jgi:hypothetical protein